MSESLAVTKLMKQADEAIEVCRICKGRGHNVGSCPHLLDWLQMKAQPQKPGMRLRALWVGIGLSALVIGLVIVIWRTM